MVASAALGTSARAAPPGNAYCEALLRLEGTWSVLATATGSDTLTHLGETQRFTLTLKQEACEATVTLDFANPAAHTLAHVTQRVPQPADVWREDVVALPLEVGRKASRTLRLWLMTDATGLHGVWAATDPAGAVGVLLGTPKGKPAPDTNGDAQRTLPCVLECLELCGGAPFTTDVSAYPAAATCANECRAGSRARATCARSLAETRNHRIEEAAPSPEAAIAALSRTEFEWSCDVVLDAFSGLTDLVPAALRRLLTYESKFAGAGACRLDDSVHGVFPPALGPSALGAASPFREAYYATIDMPADNGGSVVPRGLVLMLRTASGWHAVPLHDLAAAEPRSVGAAQFRLFTRELFSAAGPEIVGEWAVDDHEGKIVCAAGVGAPRCVEGDGADWMTFVASQVVFARGEVADWEPVAPIAIPPTGCTPDPATPFKDAAAVRTALKALRSGEGAQPDPAALIASCRATSEGIVRALVARAQAPARGPDAATRVRLFQAALALDAGNAPARFGLLAALTATGDRDAALAELGKLGGAPEARLWRRRVALTPGLAPLRERPEVMAALATDRVVTEQTLDFRVPLRWTVAAPSTRPESGWAPVAADPPFADLGKDFGIQGGVHRLVPVDDEQWSLRPPPDLVGERLFKPSWWWPTPESGPVLVVPCHASTQGEETPGFILARVVDGTLMATTVFAYSRLQRMQRYETVAAQSADGRGLVTLSHLEGETGFMTQRVVFERGAFRALEVSYQGSWR